MDGGPLSSESEREGRLLLLEYVEVAKREMGEGSCRGGGLFSVFLMTWEVFSLENETGHSKENEKG